MHVFFFFLFFLNINKRIGIEAKKKKSVFRNKIGNNLRVIKIFLESYNFGYIL